jgi:hypothetical protein
MTLTDHQSQDVHVPRPLPERNRVAGHELEMIWRKGNVAVFARSISEKAPHEHEVIIIRLKPEKTLPDGTKVLAHFAYPSNHEWGKFGWSIPKREQAIVWAETVLTNLGKPRDERTAWPELFTQFKGKIDRGK